MGDDAGMKRDMIELARDVGRQLAKRLEHIEACVAGGTPPTEDVASALDEAMERLAATGFWGPENRMASNEFWRIAEPWLRHGDLQVHARFKPRGYAGDFDLLRKICDQVCCDHPLGHAMDQYFQSQAAPCAVRDRVAIIAQRLVRLAHESTTDPTRIVSVGSGPGVELQRACEQLPEAVRQPIQVTLLDLDQQALDHAQRSLQSLISADRLTIVRTNLARLPDGPSPPTSMSAAKYLFCLGFFDYLDWDAATTMLTLFYRSLAVGGELAVFNFAPLNPSRAYMEWIGNWYLTYRSAAEMRDLAAQVAPRDRFTVREVSQGTIVELTMRRDP